MSDDWAITFVAAIATILLFGLFIMLVLGGVLGEYGIHGPDYWPPVALAAVARLVVMD